MFSPRNVGWRTIWKAIAPSLLAFILLSALLASVLTGLIARNAEPLNAAVVGEIGAIMFAVSIATNLVWLVPLVIVWAVARPFLTQQTRERWVAFLVSGLVAANAAWALLQLMHLMAVILSFNADRAFVTIAGVVQGTLLLLAAAAIVVGAVLSGTRRSALRIGVPAALVAVTLAVACLPWNEPAVRRYVVSDIREAAGSTGRAEPVAAATDPPERRLIVLGIDGMNWEVATPLMRAGKLPNLGRMVASGAIGYLDNGDETVSPRIWTTMFSGRSIHDHGIYAFEKWRLPWTGALVSDMYLSKRAAKWIFGLETLLKRLPGFVGARPVPTTSVDARVKLLWDIASDYGHRVLVANALGIVPVRPVNGAMVAFRQSLDANTIYPLELAASWEPQTPITYIDKTPAEIADSFIETTNAEIEYSIGLAEAIDAELSVFYTTMLDSVAHRSWWFYSSQTLIQDAPDGLSNDEWEEFVVDNNDAPPFRVYVALDRMLGDILSAFPDATIMICSDHGWTFSGHTHFGSPDGVLIVSGPDVVAADLSDARVEDIAPTIIAWLGAPLSAELEGRPITEAFRGQAAVGTVASYGPPPRGVTDASVVDEEELRRLRALGYIR